MSSSQKGRAATYAELEQEARKVPEHQLRSLPSFHPDQQHRTHLGRLSEEGARFYVLYLGRMRMRTLCNRGSPEGDLEHQRLWQEMTRIRILLNSFISRDVPNSRDYPPDVIFIDSNREVYVILGPWQPFADEVPDGNLAGISVATPVVHQIQA